MVSVISVRSNTNKEQNKGLIQRKQEHKTFANEKGPEKKRTRQETEEVEIFVVNHFPVLSTHNEHKNWMSCTSTNNNYHKH